MAREVKYRASGGADYVFDFLFVDGSWRAYIVCQPPLRGRAEGGHETHRLNDGRPYVCWDRPVRTEAEMRKVAALWAECTQHYIATGRFEPPAVLPPVRDRTRTERGPVAPSASHARSTPLDIPPPRGLRRLFAR